MLAPFTYPSSPQARQLYTGAPSCLCSCPSLPRHLWPPLSHPHSPPGTRSNRAQRLWEALPLGGELRGGWTQAPHRLPWWEPPWWGQLAKPEPAGMARVRGDATRRFQAPHPCSQRTAMLHFTGMLKALAHRERPSRLQSCFSCYLHKKPNQSYFLSL